LGSTAQLNLRMKKKSLYQAEIVGTGNYLPEKILTNADLEKTLDTSDEWIRTRTGIQERRIARKDESSSTLGAHAAENALKSAGMAPDELDMIIVCTSTPDVLYPSTACFVQKNIGASIGPTGRLVSCSEMVQVRLS